jgi:adhesin transport system outer membrane protein
LQKLQTFLCSIVLAWPAAGHGQERTWTFSEVLRQSLAAHPSVLASRSSAIAAEADHESAKWQRFPTPSLQSYSSQSASTGNISSFQVQQPLWTGGRITAGIDAAQFRKDAADSVVGETSRDLALRVVAAYVEAARQQTREEQARRGVAEHERLLGLIGRRVQQEVSAPVDREFAQSRLYQAINDLSLNTQQRKNALTQLTQLAGRPVENVAALGSEVVAVPQSEESALQAAIAASPTLARIAAQERAAGADVDSQRASLWPTLALRFQRNLGGIVGVTDNQLLLVLQAQPGAGLSAMSNIEAARSRQSSLEYQRDAAVRDVQERVGVDWNELRYARERLDNADLSRKTAGRVFESYTQQFTTGRKTWIDVLNAAREFTQAEFAFADADAQYAGAALRLRVNTGTLLPGAP